MADDAENALTEETPRQAADKAADERTGRGATDHTKDAGKHGAGRPGGTPKDKTPIIIAIVGIIGVVIAWVSYTHQKNQQTAADATNPALGTGSVAGGGTDTMALANMLTNMQDEITQLTGVVGQAAPPATPAAPVPTPHPPAPTPHPQPPHAPPRGAPKPPKSTGGRLPARQAPGAGTTRYTVRPGDNLSAIARRLGITGGWQAIQNVNHLPNPNLIYPGQVLTIPAAHGRGTNLGGH